jgi:hypothetical protein
MSFDGQILKGVMHLETITTASNIYKQVHAIAGMNDGKAISSSFAPMFNYYKEYKFQQVTFEWIPGVAPGVADGGSEIMIGFNWNPEQIVGATAGTAVGVAGSLRSERTVKSFNAWERFTYNVPLHNRRKMFDIDVNPGAYLTDVNVVDRSIQGAVVVVAQSPSDAVSLGHFRVTYAVRLEGLGILTT